MLYFPDHWSVINRGSLGYPREHRYRHPGRDARRLQPVRHARRAVGTGWKTAAFEKHFALDRSMRRRMNNAVHSGRGHGITWLENSAESHRVIRDQEYHNYCETVFVGNQASAYPDDRCGRHGAIACTLMHSSLLRQRHGRISHQEIEYRKENVVTGVRHIVVAHVVGAGKAQAGRKPAVHVDAPMNLLGADQINRPTKKNARRESQAEEQVQSNNYHPIAGE